MITSKARSRAQSSRTRICSLACLLLAGSLIGLSVNLAKLASTAGIALMSFLIWSIAGASLIVTTMALAFGQRAPLNRRTGEYFLLSGLLSVALPNVMFFVAAARVGVGFVALSFALPPLYTYFLALLSRIERFSASRATGVALGVTGAVIIARSKAAEPGTDLVGMVLAVGAPVVIAVGNVYRTLRWPEGASSFALAPGMLLSALLFLTSGGLLTDQRLAYPFGDISAVALLVIQILAFSTMYVIYFVLQRMAGAVYMSQVGSVGALAGSAIAILALGETPPTALPGVALLTAIAIYLVTRTVRGRSFTD